MNLADASPRQSATVPLRSMPGSRIKVWDLPLRIFHWSLVVTIAIAFLSSEEESAIAQWHYAAGWTAGLLLVFRLIWGFVGGEHSQFVDFVRPRNIGEHVSGLLRRHSQSSLGHNPLGGLAVLALLSLIALTVWSGAFGGEPAEELHEAAAWTLLGLIGLHIVAVVMMSLIHRENLIRAMVTGTKAAARHPGAEDARAAPALGILLAAAMVAGALYGILRYDPGAFSPVRVHEQAQEAIDTTNGSGR